MKLTILQSYDRNYRELAELTVPNVAKYAIKHGHNHIVDTQSRFHGRHPSWDKVVLVRRWLKTATVGDWALVMDADAVFVDMERTFQIPDNADPGFSFCSDSESCGVESAADFNAGVYLLMKRPVVEHLYEVLMTVPGHHHEPNWEQAEMQKLLRDPFYKGYVSIHPDRTHFNHRGDFVFHACGGGSVEDRIQLIKDALK